MGNVPWHEEVRGFVKQVADQLPDYEIASEHEHSNCILLAHKRVGELHIDPEYCWEWVILSHQGVDGLCVDWLHLLKFFKSSLKRKTQSQNYH